MKTACLQLTWCASTQSSWRLVSGDSLCSLPLVSKEEICWTPKQTNKNSLRKNVYQINVICSLSDFCDITLLLKKKNPWCGKTCLIDVTFGSAAFSKTCNLRKKALVIRIIIFWVSMILITLLFISLVHVQVTVVQGADTWVKSRTPSGQVFLPQGESYIHFWRYLFCTDAPVLTFWESTKHIWYTLLPAHM